MGGIAGKHYSPAEARRIRERLKLTPSEFALRFGLSRSTVSQWESGRRKITGITASFFTSLKSIA